MEIGNPNKLNLVEIEMTNISDIEEVRVPIIPDSA
jgi:hypothetical protein